MKKIRMLCRISWLLIGLAACNLSAPQEETLPPPSFTPIRQETPASETPAAVPSAVPSVIPSAVPSAMPSEMPSPEMPSPEMPSLTPSATTTAQTFPTSLGILPTDTPSPTVTPSITPTVILLPTATFAPPTVPAAVPAAVPSAVPPTAVVLQPPTAAPTLTPNTFTSPNAWVLPREAGATLYSTPGTAGMVTGTLAGNTPLLLIGRTANNDWIQVAAVGSLSGWLRYADIQTVLDIATLPVTGEAQEAFVTATPDAAVKADAGGLRVRATPGLEAPVLNYLAAYDRLRVLGRTADNQWLEIRAENGAAGWVLSAYVDVYLALDGVPVTADSPTLQPTDAPPPQPPANAFTGTISNITGTARQIYLNGQAMGNRPNVFSKVGDSITVATMMLYPIGWGRYNLGSYTHLQSVVNYFSAATARSSNSFANVSLAADNGWSTRTVLDPNYANVPVAGSTLCQAGESPLECEYRVVKPALALIMLGTNDVGGIPLDEYRANLERIVQISINRGVIPVLSTIPDRPGFDTNAYNQAIKSLAWAYSVPLWDYWAAMQSLPNQGLSSDMVHPSVAPGDYSASGDLQDHNLIYGYTVRNLTALIVLDALWRQVIQGG